MELDCQQSGGQDKDDQPLVLFCHVWVKRNVHPVCTVRDNSVDDRVGVLRRAKGGELRGQQHYRVKNLRS